MGVSCPPLAKSGEPTLRWTMLRRSSIGRLVFSWSHSSPPTFVPLSSAEDSLPTTSITFMMAPFTPSGDVVFAVGSPAILASLSICVRTSTLS